MRDYILEIAFDDPAAEELIQSRLFLTASSGSFSTDGLISAYFESAADRDRAMEALREFDVRAVEREREDWLEHYRQSLEPLFIGERFVVAPDASLIPLDTERLTLIVPQEQAFGTGSHETTSLCIEMLESLDLQGARGLDIGSGSGILAMAMLRLGAAKAVAFDNDPDAYGALRDNRARNDIAESALPLFIGSAEALRGGTFDVVTMNIIPEVIVPLLPEVVPHVAAHLILSGILIVKRDEVVAAAHAHRLMLAGERGKGEWWVGVFSPTAQGSSLTPVRSSEKSSASEFMSRTNGTTAALSGIFAGVTFEIIGAIRHVETIATGSGIHILHRLVRLYGKGNWRKLKGIATVRLEDGTLAEAEIHWFEAHGIGKRRMKIKRLL